MSGSDCWRAVGTELGPFVEKWLFCISTRFYLVPSQRTSEILLEAAKMTQELELAWCRKAGRAGGHPIVGREENIRETFPHPPPGLPAWPKPPLPPPCPFQGACLRIQ